APYTIPYDSSSAHPLGFSQGSADANGTVTTNAVVDLTGDGRADLIYVKNNKLYIATNRPTGDGGQYFDLTALPQPTNVFGPPFRFLDYVTATSVDPDPDTGDDHGVTEHVWRQLIDMNGDGRLDVVDALEEPGHWVVYLNKPTGFIGRMTWVRKSIDVSSLMGE